MHLRPPSIPSTPSSSRSSRSPSTALTTPSPAHLPRVLTPSGLRDVRVPVERIDPVLAGRMVSVLLESVLYVKGQVPMSVQQMRFIGEGGKNARAAKKRLDLLSTLDELSSHLSTTFIRLSTALARRKSPGVEEGETGRACVLITLGPPTGGGRERVLLELEGLEVRDWSRPVGVEAEDEDEEEEEEEEEDVEEDEAGEDAEQEEDAAEEDDLEQSDREDDHCSEQEASDAERSTVDFPAVSPHKPAANRELFPLPQVEPPSPSSGTSSRQSSLSPLNSPCPVRTLPPSRLTQRPPPDPARMLALALINLNQTQAPPTRVHIFLRAPRRFEHPVWEPRLNVSRALDGACFGFGEGVSKVNKTQPERVTVITTRPPSTPPPSGPIGAASPARSNAEDGEDDEEDESVWFEWTGKLQGFMEI